MNIIERKEQFFFKSYIDPISRDLHKYIHGKLNIDRDCEDKNIKKGGYIRMNYKNNQYLDFARTKLNYKNERIADSPERRNWELLRWSINHNNEMKRWAFYNGNNNEQARQESTVNERLIKNMKREMRASLRDSMYVIRGKECSMSAPDCMSFRELSPSKYNYNPGMRTLYGLVSTETMIADLAAQGHNCTEITSQDADCYFSGMFILEKDCPVGGQYTYRLRFRKLPKGMFSMVHTLAYKK